MGDLDSFIKKPKKTAVAAPADDMPAPSPKKERAPAVTAAAAPIASASAASSTSGSLSGFEKRPAAAASPAPSPQKAYIAPTTTTAEDSAAIRSIFSKFDKPVVIPTSTPIAAPAPAPSVTVGTPAKPPASEAANEYSKRPAASALGPAAAAASKYDSKSDAAAPTPKKTKDAAGGDSKTDKSGNVKFKLSDFGVGAYDVKALVNKLTKQVFNPVSIADQKAKAVAAAAAAGDRSKPPPPLAPDPVFDPVPFQAMLDATIEQLKTLRNDADANIEGAMDSAKEEDEKHKKNLSKLQNSLNSIFSKFRRLDERIASVSTTAVRLGETLETADQQKKLSADGQRMIEHFLSFNSGDASRLDPVFLEPKRIHEAATLIQTLHTISGELRVHGVSKAVSSISAKQNEIENSLIVHFDRALRDKDEAAMRTVAKTLWIFPNRSVIQRYVSTALLPLPNDIRDFDRKTPSNDAANGDSKDSKSAAATIDPAAAASDFKKAAKPPALPTLAPPPAASAKPPAGTPGAGGVGIVPVAPPPPELKTRLTVGDVQTRTAQFYALVVNKIQTECGMIAKVFPAPVLVLKNLFDQLFGNKLMLFIDSALGEYLLTTREAVTYQLAAPSSHDDINESYLTVLYLMHTKTEELCDMLTPIIKQFGIKTGAAPATARGAAGSTALERSSSTSGGKRDSTATSSGGALADSGLNIRDGAAQVFYKYRVDYMSRELEVLRTCIEKRVNKALSYEVLDFSLLNMNSAATAASAAIGIDKDLIAKAMRKKGSKPTVEEMYTWIKRVVDEDTMSTLMGYATAAVGRCDKLSDPVALIDNIKTIFDVFMERVVKDYVHRVVDRCDEYLPEAEPKTEPDLFYLTCVKYLDRFSKRLDVHYQTEIVRRLSASPDPTPLTLCEQRRTELWRSVEERILRGIDACINSSVKHAGKLLSKQAPATYKPKESDSAAAAIGMDIDIEPTKECSELCKFISVCYKAALKALDGKNLDKYLTIFGIRLYRVVLSHLRKFTVSQVGATIMLRDVQSMQTKIKKFSISSVNELFSRLIHYVKLCTGPVDTLPFFLSDPKYRTINESGEVADFLKARSDHGSGKNKDKITAWYIEHVSHPPAGAINLSGR